MAGIRTRKRGKTYSYIFEAGKKENGKRNVIEKGGYVSKQEAFNAGVEAYNDFKHGGIGITSSRITVKDFLNSWLENVAKGNIKINSYVSYKTCLTSKIVPYIGLLSIQEVTPIHVDNLLRDLFNKGYSYKTLVFTRTVLSNALSYAVYPAMLISSNPTQYVKIPKQARRNIIPRKIISKEFMESLDKDSPYYVPCMIMYHTGMRIGEVLGLRWSHINNNVIEVKLQAKRLLHGAILTEPKTKSSCRSILIDNELLTLLAEHYKRQQKARAENQSYIVQYIDDNGYIKNASHNLITSHVIIDDFVCTRTDGRFITYPAINVYFRKLGINAHSFRHTHTTQLIEAGASLKGVSDRLGHKSITITQDLYTHVTDKIKKDTLNAFEGAINADKNENADKKQTNKTATLAK